MSSTKSVGFGETKLWVYDASLSLLLAELISMVEQRQPNDRPGWWSEVERVLRVHATVSDLHLELGLGLDDAQREEFASLLAEATDRVQRRGTFTLEEASRWPLLDGQTVLFRGAGPIDTAAVAALGAAIVELLGGRLPAAPPGTQWLLGTPEGWRTIAMRDQA